MSVSQYNYMLIYLPAASWNLCVCVCVYQQVGGGMQLAIEDVVRHTHEVCRIVVKCAAGKPFAAEVGQSM